jgi:hypothetical protein
VRLQVELLLRGRRHPGPDVLVLHAVHRRGQGGHAHRLHAHDRRHLHLRRGLQPVWERRDRELRAVLRRHLRGERRHELSELRVELFLRCGRRVLHALLLHVDVQLALHGLRVQRREHGVGLEHLPVRCGLL